MMISQLDFTPECLYRAHEELVRNLLPQAWWSRMIPREITAWAHLFAIGGMAVYDSKMEANLTGCALDGESVGTWLNIEGEMYFLGHNERRAWSHKAPATSRWQAPRLCSLALRTCKGPVDARADVFHAQLSGIAEVVQAHASTSHAFRALLSLGRLYNPSVNKDLRYTPCISEHSELYSEYEL
ncbi:MAG: hypothetical protein J5615_10015 [Fibrobacter sp.]|nr:hypothetical protein [Fibrobacter sp.]